ncbi:hypothetical protein L2E82_40398 [Cichorium intybus]|uniref:Uncharacterized protein n=1 Tax=Cichorium intybus TaxID=13427 RepID=A0ACB9ALI8_CICIN|nr:hypothetical protein L2E82_40398 [Cichorium intybus]
MVCVSVFSLAKFHTQEKESTGITGKLTKSSSLIIMKFDICDFFPSPPFKLVSDPSDAPISNQIDPENQIVRSIYGHINMADGSECRFWCVREDRVASPSPFIIIR